MDIITSQYENTEGVLSRMVLLNEHPNTKLNRLDIPMPFMNTVNAVDVNADGAIDLMGSVWTAY